jgi:hypothetical protein
MVCGQSAMMLVPIGMFPGGVKGVDRRDGEKEETKRERQLVFHLSIVVKGIINE